MNSNLLENRIGCYATDAGNFQIKKISRWALPEGCKRSSSPRVGPPESSQAIKLDKGSGIL